MVALDIRPIYSACDLSDGSQVVADLEREGHGKEQFPTKAGSKPVYSVLKLDSARRLNDPDRFFGERFKLASER